MPDARRHSVRLHNKRASAGGLADTVPRSPDQVIQVTTPTPSMPANTGRGCNIGLLPCSPLVGTGMGDLRPWHDRRLGQAQCSSWIGFG